MIHYPASSAMLTGKDDDLVYLMARSILVKHRPTGKTIDRINGISNCCGCLSPDGQYVAFTNYVGQIHVYHATIPHQLCFKFDLRESTLRALSFCDDGKFLLVGCNEKVYAFSIPDGKMEIFFELPKGFYCPYISVSDTKILISACAPGVGHRRDSQLFLFRCFHDQVPQVITLCDDNEMAFQYGSFLDSEHFVTYMRHRVAEMHFFALNDNLNMAKPDQIIRIPTFSFVFSSPDNRFFSVLAFDLKCTDPAHFRNALLYRADTWDLVQMIDLPYTIYAQFSSTGRYWLISSGQESKIIEI